MKKAKSPANDGNPEEELKKKKGAEEFEELENRKLEKNNIVESSETGTLDNKEEFEDPDFQDESEMFYENDEYIEIENNDESSEEDLLDSEGKFKDPDLQNKYEKYCEYKNKAGKEPREPLDWKKASDKWALLRKQGEDYERKKFDEFQAKYKNAQPQITIITNKGTKIRVDAIAIDENKNIIIQEYKSSADAPYTKNQKKGFKELRDYGGIIVGEGKKGFEGGKVIDKGVRVKVVRPNGEKYFDEE